MLHSRSSQLLVKRHTASCLELSPLAQPALISYQPHRPQHIRSMVRFCLSDLRDLGLRLECCKAGTPSCWSSSALPSCLQKGLASVSPVMLSAILSRAHLAAPAEAALLQGRSSQLLVKRRTAQLPAELQVGSPASEGIDWHASVMLNLVMQTSYQLTLAACRQASCMLQTRWTEVLHCRPVPEHSTRYPSFMLSGVPL